MIGFGITKKTISSFKQADGLVVGSALCKEITKSIKKDKILSQNLINGKRIEEKKLHELDYKIYKAKNKIII